MYWLGKHGFVNYAAAKLETSIKTNLLTCKQLEFRAFAKSKKDETSSYEGRLTNTSAATFVSFRILFFEEN